MFSVGEFDVTWVGWVLQKTSFVLNMFDNFLELVWQDSFQVQRFWMKIFPRNIWSKSSQVSSNVWGEKLPSARNLWSEKTPKCQESLKWKNSQVPEIFEVKKLPSPNKARIYYLESGGGGMTGRYKSQEKRGRICVVQDECKLGPADLE